MLNVIKSFIKKNFTKKYWESSLSKKWHNKRKEDFQGDFEIFANSIINNVGGKGYNNVLEIGTGAGYLIYFLSENLSGYHGFFGVDINKKIIEENKESYKNHDRLKFVHSDVYEYIECVDLDNLLIVAQNTFDYFNRKRLEEIFLLIIKKFDNVAIAINSHERNSHIEGSLERKDSDLKVYSHNYIEILRKVGFKFIESENMPQDSGVIILAYSREN